MTNLVTCPTQSRRSRALAVVLILALAAGCASVTPGETGAIGDAATRPLRDVGLVKTMPPAALAAAEKAPYAVVDGAGCAALAAEIVELDQLLGPDIDVAPETVDTLAEDLVAQAVGGIVDIPFRSAVRRVSGAEARDRAMRRAKLGGQLRRAFLKGLALGRRCTEGG